MLIKLLLCIHHVAQAERGLGVRAHTANLRWHRIVPAQPERGLECLALVVQYLAVLVGNEELNRVDGTAVECRRLSESRYIGGGTADH